MKRFVFILLITAPTVGIGAGCSQESPPVDLEAFRERVELSCADGCEQVLRCSPGYPFDTYDECYEHCTGWDVYQTPNQCASRSMDRAECTSDLSCEEYQEYRDHDPTSDQSYPCDELNRRFNDCRRTEEYGT